MSKDEQGRQGVRAMITGSGKGDGLTAGDGGCSVYTWKLSEY